MTRWRVAALLVWAFVFASARGASAEERACARPGALWVRLVLEGDRFTPPLRASVLQQLTSDLAQRGLAVCAGSAAGEPVAELQLVLVRGEWLSIELRDEVSHERFAREISLAGVPDDALGLSIAAAGEELLHASWTQNAVAPAPVPSSAPSVVAAAPPSSATPNAPAPEASPPPARSAERPATHGRPADLESSTPRAAQVAPRVSLLGAFESAIQGESAFGADAGFAWGGRATLGARLGFRLAPETSSPHGAVGMREGVVGLTSAVALVPRDAVWGGEILVRGDLRYVEFNGVASPTARALRGSATGVLLGGGMAGWARMARSWSLVAEATGGAPIHAVTASDSGTVVTGIRGFVIGFALGVETRL